MLVYKYDEKGIFVGAEETELDPLESELQGKEICLLPPNATFDAPEEKDGFAPVWDGKTWTQIEDHRGTKYWMPEDKNGDPAREMKDIGPLPEGASLTEPEPTAEELAAQELAQAKAERADAVSKIIVEVDGMQFDGDETAQSRIGRTIAAAVAIGVDLATEKRTWVLADNSIAQVSIKQLAEALRLAGDAQTALWTVPYANDK